MTLTIAEDWAICPFARTPAKARYKWYEYPTYWRIETRG